MINTDNRVISMNLPTVLECIIRAIAGFRCWRTEHDGSCRLLGMGAGRSARTSLAEPDRYEAGPTHVRQPGIEFASGSRAEGAAMARNVTLLDLVNAVAERARSEAELIATVVYMVNQGHVRLCGTFKGARFDLTAFAAA
jgi:hypothetical protein